MTPELIAGPFASILEDQRARFNLRFADARRARPRLDPAAFADHLRGPVAGIVSAVAQAAPERAADVAGVLFDLSLDLVGEELLGPASRYPHLVDGWRTLLPGLARFVAQAPREVVGAVTNALYNLSVTPGARPDEWSRSLAALSSVCPDSAALLEAGKVSAWRAGLAHYRASALDVCRTLPPPVGRAALGLEPAPAALDGLLDQLAADPWLRPGQGGNSSNRQLRLVARAGAFRGFGGQFMAPPRVTVADGHFVVTDGGSYWWLAADVHGAVLQRTSPPRGKARPEPAFRVDRAGQVAAAGQSQTFPELAGSASQASLGHTLAVTLPLSHAIYLVAFADG